VTVQAGDRPLVAVSVPAQAWLVRQVAAEYADVQLMLPAGHVPENSEPGPRRLAALYSAQLYLLVGHPAFLFETRHVLPHLRQHHIRRLSMFDLAAGNDRVDIAEADPHLWTSPSIMLQTAIALTEELAQLDPLHAGQYKRNLADLQHRILELDKRYRLLGAARPGAIFLVYHPAWGNFARDYGFRQVAIEEHGKSPGAARLSKLIGELAGQAVDRIIVSPGHEQRSAALLARQLQAQVVVIDPLDADWWNMMQEMHRTLEQIIERN
jgi:zinc transport system substrate-binding protein